VIVYTNLYPRSADCPAGSVPGSHGYDFLSRFFAPWAGITEDPATGSAHAVLGPYWSARLGRTSLFARQCSPRGADVWVDMGPEEGRVRVSGQGVVVLRGSLLLPAGRA
jgi:predicted PhzF superfamily epimerase YddE/YHI9